MKQTLQLKLSQHLTLTPQLQQSIRLLQLSTVELNAEVERMLQENPLLEKAEGEDEPLPSAGELAGVSVAPTADEAQRDADREKPDESEVRERTDAVERTDFEDYSGGESDWGGSGATDDDEEGFYPQQVATSTLRDHLLSQLAVLNVPVRDRQLVGALIDALDEDGYLHSSLEELAEVFPPELEIEPDELSIALCYLQSFEPAGIGARDAAECLALQLKALPESTPFRAEALTVVSEHLPLLAARDFTKLKRLLHTDDAGVRAMRALVMSLSPRPGASFAKSEANFVIPDVVVKKVRGKWVATLNESAMPKLRLNRIYADILTRNRDSSNQQLSAQLQEAKWLIRNVQQRFETILRVSQAIVERQRRFFEHGDVAMRPMVLREIATMLESARVDDFAGDHAEVHADDARHLRAQVFLRQPCRHRHRRRRVGHGDPRADQAADRRRGREVADDRQPDRGSPGRAGHHRRPAHRRQIPGGIADSSRQPAQGALKGQP